MKIADARRTGHTFDPRIIKAMRARAKHIRATGRVAHSRSLKAILAHADAIEHGKPTISPGKARLQSGR